MSDRKVKNQKGGNHGEVPACLIRELQITHIKAQHWPTWATGGMDFHTQHLSVTGQDASMQIQG